MTCRERVIRPWLRRSWPLNNQVSPLFTHPHQFLIYARARETMINAPVEPADIPTPNEGNLDRVNPVGVFGLVGIALFPVVPPPDPRIWEFDKTEVADEFSEE